MTQDAFQENVRYVIPWCGMSRIPGIYARKFTTIHLPIINHYYILYYIKNNSENYKIVRIITIIYFRFESL